MEYLQSIRKPRSKIQFSNHLTLLYCRNRVFAKS
jgi:hypothetical protein